MMTGSSFIVFLLTAACGAHQMQGLSHGTATVRRVALDLHQPKEAKEDRGGPREEARERGAREVGARMRASTTSPPQQPKSKLKKEIDTVIPDKVEQQAVATRRSITTFDMHKELSWVLDAAIDTFMPEFQIELFAFVKALLTVILGVVWFGTYLNFMYVDDRSEKLEAWKEKIERDADQLSSPRSSYTPDFMLVFHNPAFEYKDNANTVSAASLKRILMNNEDCMFSELDKLKNEAGEGTGSLEKVVSAIRAVTVGSGTEEVKSQVEMLDARKALLKDMYRSLPLLGFDATVFSSIDGDELFVCASLDREEVIQYYLRKNNAQVQLRHDIVARLGILQDPDDPASSPPSVSYDLALVERLHEIGILGSKEETELFKSCPDFGKASVVTSTECIWTIHNEILQHVDLCAAKEEGLLVTWYPVHNPSQIALFQTIWASWGHLLDLTFRQPIPSIKEYFGPRIAFLFEWNGVYCKGLLVLMAIALVQASLVRFGRNVLGIEVLKSRQVLGFSIVLVVWSKFMQNLYLREQNFFLELWNIRPHGAGSHVTRPQFQGEMGPSQSDANIEELQFSSKTQFLRILLTGVATVGFCCLEACCIFMWLLIFDGKMGIFSSLMLSLMIKVFEAVFTILATCLTEYENHKHEADYHNSLLWKLFLLNFVNNYCAFFFMTIRNAWMGCLDECLFILRKQVTLCLMILAICSILQMLVAHFSVKFSLYMELRNLAKKGEAVVKRYVLEEESKYAVIDSALELQNMMTLVIALGHVMLFGGVSAAVVPYCFILFTVQLRAFAVQLTTCSQRPFPHTSQGVGHWQHCITFLTFLGVLYAGFLFVAYGAAFRGSTLRAKMTGVVLFCLLGFGIWAIIGVVFPPEDKNRRLMCERRAHVARRLVSRVADKGLAVMREATLEHMTVCNADLINDGKWESIKPLADMPVGPKTPSRRLSGIISEETPSDSIHEGSS